MSLRLLWVKSVTANFWHAYEQLHCSSSSCFLCAQSLQLHLHLFFLLQPFQHQSLSGLQPDARHHLFIHGPRHGRHHGPPQRPRNGPSEEALESIFLREWEQSEACSWLKPAYSTRYMERNLKTRQSRKEDWDSYHIDVSDGLCCLELWIHLDMCFDHISRLSDEGGQHTSQNPAAEVSHRSHRRRADL